MGYLALAVAVPGALKSWCETAARYGCLDLDTLLQPASRARFLPDDAPPQPGQIRRCEEYAETLQCLAREDAEALGER